MVLSAHLFDSSSQSLFGIFDVPAKIYPWILLILIQLLMPGASFIGHLSGFFFF
jgi:hypothetical protein